MNRLIIIGNGFDLAHGLKSSFKDFIANYFCNAVNHFFEGNTYSDILFELSFTNDFHPFEPRSKPTTSEDIFEILDKLNKNKKNINLKFNSLLLQNIYAKIKEVNWVDLEIEFFKILVATKNVYKNQNQFEAIKNVNEQLDFLKNKLVIYLSEEEKKYSNTFDKSELLKCFLEEINKEEIVTTYLRENKLPDNLYFLNFNYTRTFMDYFELSNNQIRSKFNFIHGDLKEEYGNPIFGFGDEFDKRYLEFEDENNNQLFKHIKSFEYSQNKNYFNLIRFIDSGDYQIQVFGHSCGVSDRTMLNEIFENTNCKSIKIFYHELNDKVNDFSEKTYDIAKHFKNKGVFRKKLIPFDLSRPMPQPKNK